MVKTVISPLKVFKDIPFDTIMYGPSASQQQMELYITNMSWRIIKMKASPKTYKNLLRFVPFIKGESLCPLEHMG